jgi:hypothetical protein
MTTRNTKRAEKEKRRKEGDTVGIIGRVWGRRECR